MQIKLPAQSLSCHGTKPTGCRNPPLPSSQSPCSQLRFLTVTALLHFAVTVLPYLESDTESHRYRVTQN